MTVRRALVALTALAVAFGGVGSLDVADAAIGVLESTPAQETPLPDPAFLDPVPGQECRPENAYEDAQWEATVGPLEGVCERLRFAYGPIPVKPGQNDALLVPVVIDKPAYDGYVLRFKPDLLLADGTAPPVDQIHLHHAVWLRGEEALGGPGGFPPERYNEELIPFFASGEEKTTALFPAGHGYPVQATDSWLLLFMVHNYTTRTDAVWITYDIDFVKADDAEDAGITPVHPVWLDVQRRPIAPGAPDTPANPVFNVQKGYGHHEDRFGNDVAADHPDARSVCTWPDENCARFDPYGKVTPQQGIEVPIDGAYEGIDAELRGAPGGTLVWMGGHMHPGGVRVDVDLVRGGIAVPIFSSEGVGWSRSDPGPKEGLGNAGGPTDSWDFSMTTVARHHGWAVNVKRGDRFRINATYHSDISWYENMGIAVGFVALDGGTGIDVFADGVTTERGVPVDAPRPASGWSPPSCVPAPDTLCTLGVPTHAHLPESSNFGGGTGSPLPGNLTGVDTDVVAVGDFTFGQAEQGTVRGTGLIPEVAVGETMTFVNVDTAADVWHTITRCAEPCAGASGLAYPKADGADDLLGTADDYDSSEIGYGLFLSPAKSHLDEDVENFGWGWWENPFSPPVGQFADDLAEGVLWEFTPDAADAGKTVTFYCRIHISMRGAVRVAPSQGA